MHGIPREHILCHIRAGKHRCIQSVGYRGICNGFPIFFDWLYFIWHTYIHTYFIALPSSLPPLRMRYKLMTLISDVIIHLLTNYDSLFKRFLALVSVRVTLFDLPFQGEILISTSTDNLSRRTGKQISGINRPMITPVSPDNCT